MDLTTIKPGTQFKVIKEFDPHSLAAVKPSQRIFLGEILTFQSWLYNSCDGFYMVYFDEREDGSQAVFVGDYGEERSLFESEFDAHFKLC